MKSLEAGGSASQGRIWMMLSLFIIVAFQSIATLLYNLPPNYTARKFDRQLNHYMEPYLAQSWSLFAPNPGRWNPSCYVRYAMRNVRGGFKTTDWLDGNALFSRANSANPLDKMALEREIYFGEVLIATNDIATIRKSIRGRSFSPARPAPINILSRNALSVERLFMAMAPALDPDTNNHPYFVQIALREELAQKFDDRFPAAASKNTMHKVLNEIPDSADSSTASKLATLVLPWIPGEHLSGFVDSVSR